MQLSFEQRYPEMTAWMQPTITPIGTVSDSNISDSEPQHPLIVVSTASQEKKRKSCPLKIKYRLPLLTENGVVFMVVWNLFFVIAFFSCVSQLLEWQDYAVAECGILLSLFPFVGYIADGVIGRYKVIKLAMYFLLLAVIIKTTGILILNDSLVTPYLATAPLGLAGACHIACTIQFTIDQAVGASGEELSFILYWLFWGILTGASVGIDLQMIDNDETGLLSEILLFCVASSSLLVTVFMMECCSCKLMTRPQLSNPIKQLVKVLNYARKHKFPERRSALTYWESDYPSRIDLGKDKYGGPFTVEEVEDIKTFFRLLPVICCTTAFMLLAWNKGYIEAKRQNINDNFFFTFGAALYIFGLPVYHFFIYPFLYNYIPSMLKRVGLGYLLMLINILARMIIALQTNGLSSCNLKSDLDPETWWEIILNFAFALSNFLVYFSFFEFVIAQTPSQVKGLLLCVSFACIGVFCALGYGVQNFIDSMLVDMSSRLFVPSPFSLLYYGKCFVITVCFGHQGIHMAQER